MNFRNHHKHMLKPLKKGKHTCGYEHEAMFIRKKTRAAIPRKRCRITIGLTRENLQKKIMNKKSFQLPNRIYSSKLAKQITHETHNPPFASYAVISSSQALDSFDGTCKGSNKIQFERNNQSISVIWVLYRWCYIIQTNKSMNPSTIWDTGNPSWLERVVAMSTSKVQTIEKVPGEIPVFSLGKSTCCFFSSEH